MKEFSRSLRYLPPQTLAPKSFQSAPIEEKSAIKDFQVLKVKVVIEYILVNNIDFPINENIFSCVVQKWWPFLYLKIPIFN